MNLLDDLEAVMWWSGDGAVNPTFEAYERLRTLLSHPGAQAWLAALPGLLELGEKATPGEWKCGGTDPHWRREIRSQGDLPIAWFGSFPEREALGNASLAVALRNALHAAAEAREGDGE